MTTQGPTARRRARRAGVILAWVAAAAAATFASSLAVGAIGDGIVPAAEQPLTPDEVDRRLAEPTTAAPPRTTTTSETPTPSATTTSSTSSSAPPPTEFFNSPGGSVTARCTPGPEVTAVPAQGYTVKDKEPEDGGIRVRFERGDTRVEVTVTCIDGIPQASTRIH